MKNQPVFVRIFIPERGHHLLSEFALRIVSIVVEINADHYFVDDRIC